MYQWVSSFCFLIRKTFLLFISYILALNIIIVLLSGYLIGIKFGLQNLFRFFFSEYVLSLTLSIFLWMYVNVFFFLLTVLPLFFPLFFCLSLSFLLIPQIHPPQREELLDCSFDLEWRNSALHYQPVFFILIVLLCDFD